MLIITQSFIPLLVMCKLYIGLGTFIPEIMSEQDCVWFTRPITGAEFWDSVQSMGPFKPDGIQGMFYIHNWSVSGPICGMVLLVISILS